MKSINYTVLIIIVVLIVCVLPTLVNQVVAAFCNRLAYGRARVHRGYIIQWVGLLCKNRILLPGKLPGMGECFLSGCRWSVAAELKCF